MLNLYRVFQTIEDNEEVFVAHELLVRATDSTEALRIVVEDDREEPRCLGWGDATVEMIGWATGPAMEVKEILA
jgi:hypothetical protein